MDEDCSTEHAEEHLSGRVLGDRRSRALDVDDLKGRGNPAAAHTTIAEGGDVLEKESDKAPNVSCGLPQLRLAILQALTGTRLRVLTAQGCA